MPQWFISCLVILYTRYGHYVIRCLTDWSCYNKMCFIDLTFFQMLYKRMGYILILEAFWWGLIYLKKKKKKISQQGTCETKTKKKKFFLCQWLLLLMTRIAWIITVICRISNVVMVTHCPTHVFTSRTRVTILCPTAEKHHPNTGPVNLNYLHLDLQVALLTFYNEDIFLENRQPVLFTLDLSYSEKPNATVKDLGVTLYANVSWLSNIPKTGYSHLNSAKIRNMLTLLRN